MGASYTRWRFSALRGLPPGKRAGILAKEYGLMPKAGLTGEQWIRSRKHSLYLIAFLATLLIALIMFAIAAGRTMSEPGKSGRDEARPTPEATITPSPVPDPKGVRCDDLTDPWVNYTVKDTPRSVACDSKAGRTETRDVVDAC